MSIKSRYTIQLKWEKSTR